MLAEHLNILLISPPHFRGCPPNYINSGSIEQTACLVANRLAKMGHEVTLFASGDTLCPSNVQHLYHFEEAPLNYYSLQPIEVSDREVAHKR